jgi:hypothetical protein
MIKNELKVITKDWFKKNIISFDKDFLSKKYANIKENNKIKEQLIKIFGSEFMNQIDEAGIENDLFNKKVRRETTIVKIVEIDELPSSNDADENIIYAIKDEKAIDEDCKYHLYVAVDDENEETKVWVEISSPSYIFETENIDFYNEFRGYDTLFRRRPSYLNWEALQTKLLTFDNNYNYSLNRKLRSGDFVYNNKESNFPTVELWYDEEADKLYVDTKEYKDDKDTFAQLILNEDSEPLSEDDVKYYYIAVKSLGSFSGICGSYNEASLTSGEYVSAIDDVACIYKNYRNSMSLYFYAEKLDGVERKDGSVYKYIGPKYTFLNFYYDGSRYIYYLKSFDGNQLVTIDQKGPQYGDEVQEERDNLVNNVKIDENGRTYLIYDDYGYYFDSNAEEILRTSTEDVLQLISPNEEE